MKKLSLLFYFFFCFSIINISAQDLKLQGAIVDRDNNPLIYANVALYNKLDSSLVKVELSDELGKFDFRNISSGTYFLQMTYLSYQDLIVDNIVIIEDVDLGVNTMLSEGVELEMAVVKAKRAMIEVKPDRTVFNIEGTINSAGDNAMGLLRKAPGVLLDNNNNITVLGRNGVLLYIDGKRLPLTGDELNNYMLNLPAEQIDRIDIITNPGAKYEAEGNAGIIDIRLKKDKNMGGNGSISSNLSDGEATRAGVSLLGNFRTKSFNTFGTLGYNDNENYNKMTFLDNQNGLVLDRESTQISQNTGYNYRWGTDFYVGKNQILGFLVNGSKSDGNDGSISTDALASFGSSEIDSILVASRDTDFEQLNNSFNINYRINAPTNSFSVDVDYGRYNREADTDQPNTYFKSNLTDELTVDNKAYLSPVNIDIYTFKTDYETDLAGGKFGVGAKMSKVVTENTFLFYDVNDSNERIQNDRRSNLFDYDEMVYAGYVNYSRSLSEKWNFNSGVRLEQTHATGDLQAFLEELQEPPVEQDYLSVFPNLGFTYQAGAMHLLSANYGRRINRPDYNVLNPFKSQISELSFSKGNPFLLPEIVNNIELGYTWKYRYNFKLSYSKTTDQITRLIGPDDSDPRAGFINWDNLSTQYIYGINASLPIQLTKGISSYFNLGINYKDNQADYGDGAIVDVQAVQYNIYQQHTINLPYNFIGEVSGWFNGPGIWGGVFEYDESYSLNFGLQRKFFQDNMNVKLSVQDVFRQAGWSGESQFDGLTSIGAGYWDSRRVSMSLSYSFGNKNVKSSRQRKTGLEEESKRTGQ